MRQQTTALIIITLLFGSASMALAENEINLSNAKSGALIKASGGSFAQTFAGQSLSGPEITGQPVNPLTLSPAGKLFVDPMGKINTIYSEVTYKGPISLLLDTDAKSLCFIMGHGQPPGSLKIDFFNAEGTLVHSVTQKIVEGYNIYNFKEVGTFRGVTIHENDDPAGLRFYDFHYE
ncbi:MAG: hypothetical protein HY809_01590 [Nitrospirae bacterium]|nr:hypothetical protein [Nitrospirota bacterium]